MNHNGDMDLARRTIDAARASGADAVKFQNYRTEDFISDRSIQYEYMSGGQSVVESQYDMFKRCELSDEDLALLAAHCSTVGIGFHSTPTSEDGLRRLVELGVPVLKNGSDYLTHRPLIAAMGRSGLPTVISTGMATLAEVDEAVRAFRQTGNEQLILLHCTSIYPTPPADTHLRKMSTLRMAFGCLVGFSDHTEGSVAAAVAVAIGACWVEKHFTLDKSLPGPDHRFSADPGELAGLVQAIRLAELAQGTPALGPTPGELESRRAFRLSCVADREMKAGDVLREGDIRFRRPGTGLAPGQAKSLIGRRLARQVPRGHVFVEKDFQ